ncbi:hypothetical protein CVT26_006718 [Gymnopilus dilepis]|uniref:NYN domain-containing protein n=1 Tax=Gymnopilus dilepis TaxID=231916 RepID=A0A409W0T5_9AGAR|nr:hypothetical protein CVT26_006718 [Gymnopilus dilepis]
MLISGDRDFAYAISTLRLRRYRIVLVTLSNAHSSLTAQASVCLDWSTHVLSPTDVSQRNSSHSRQGSSQEKPTAVVTPNVQSELAEVDRDDDIGLLQTIIDATEKRLLSRPYPSNISAERVGTSNQQYKDTNSPAYAQRPQPVSPSNKAWRPNLGPTAHPSRISNDANGLNSAPSTTIASQKPYLPSIPKQSGHVTETFGTAHKVHPPALYPPTEGVCASLQHPPDPYVSFSEPYRTHPRSAWPAVQQSPPVTFNPSFRCQPSIPSYGPPQSSQYPPSSGLANVSPYGNEIINNLCDKPISKLAPAPSQIPVNPTPVSGFARSDGDGEISMPVPDTPSPSAMRRSANVPFTSPGETSSSVAPSNASNSRYKADEHPDHIPSSSLSAGSCGKPEMNANKSSSSNITSSKPSTTHRRTASSPSSLESSEPSSTLNSSPSTEVQPTDESSSTSTLTFSSDCEASPSDSETTGFSSEFKSHLSPITLPPSSLPSPPPVSSPPPPSEVLQKTIAVAHAVSADQASSGSAAAAVPQPKVVPEVFKILVECLQNHRAKGNLRPLRGSVSLQISMNGATYAKAGVAKFGQYVALAVKQGIVELGGWEGGAWISLKPDWYNASALKAVSRSVPINPMSPVAKDTPLPVSPSASKAAPTPLPPPQTPNTVTSTTTQFVAPSSELSSPAVLENDKSLSPVPPTVSTPEIVDETAQLSLNNPILSPQQSSTSMEIAKSPSACKGSLPSESSSHSNEPTLADDCTNKDSCDAAEEEVSVDPPDTHESQPVSSEDLPTDTNPPPVVVQVVIPIGASEAPAPPISDSAPQSFTPAAHPNSSPSIELTDETKAPSEPVPLHSPTLDVGCSTKTSNALPVTKNDNFKSVTAPVPASPSSPAAPKAVQGIFDILVKRLQAYKSNGIEQPLRSTIALEISKNGSTYKQAGVQTFAEYTLLAKKRQIIELGGSGGKAWISLKSNLPSSVLPTQPEVVAPAPTPVTVPEMFKVLVRCLQLHRSKGAYCPTWSLISYQVNEKGTTYQKAGVSKFKQYIALAEKAGIVEYGAVANDGWVRLKPEWHDIVVT